MLGKTQDAAVWPGRWPAAGMSITGYCCYSDSVCTSRCSLSPSPSLSIKCRLESPGLETLQLWGHGAFTETQGPSAQRSHFEEPSPGEELAAGTKINMQRCSAQMSHRRAGNSVGTNELRPICDGPRQLFQHFRRLYSDLGPHSQHVLMKSSVRSSTIYKNTATLMFKEIHVDERDVKSGL